MQNVRALLPHDAQDLHIHFDQIPARALLQRNQADSTRFQLLGQSAPGIERRNDDFVAARGQFIGHDDQLAFRASNVQLPYKKENFHGRFSFFSRTARMGMPSR
jgi:hypothetical protein